MKNFLRVTNLSRVKFCELTRIELNHLDGYLDKEKLIGAITAKKLAHYFNVPVMAIEELKKINDPKVFSIKMVLYQITTGTEEQVNALINLLRTMTR